jgi:conjugative relaxase-like TrwC/TraI family protein
MICSVTVLGAQKGASPAGAAGAIAEYLHGKKPDRGRPMEGRTPPPDPAVPDMASPDPASSDTVSRYYGDSSEGQGRWLGSGFGDSVYTGDVDSAEFVELLLGTDPRTGGRLIGGKTSTPRTRGAHEGDPKALDGLAGDDLVGFTVASKFLGVSRAYLKDLAARSLEARETGTDPTGATLDAAKTGSRNSWQVRVDELRRFAATRTESSAVLGYDVTFSCPKSVSLLWSMVNPAERVQILEAVESAVRAGIGYLEANGCAVKVGGELVAGGGLLAAGYLHATSRALDPQLHWHCVVLNATTAPNGAPRALDGRGLFAHGKTAGYLAGAHLRHELTNRLGVSWDEPVNGLADIVGIDRDAIEVFSKRSSEIGEIAEAAGLHTANGRQAAALGSRSAKTAVDAGELIDGWHDELSSRGYDGERIDSLLHHDPPMHPSDRDVRRFFTRLVGPEGLTELTPVFDRRDIIQAISEWAGSRLTSDRIVELADNFCCHRDLVRLEGGWSRPGAVILRGDGRAAPAASGAAYTTIEILELEAEITERFQAGFGAGSGTVDARHVHEAIAHRPSLGADQAAMVGAICTSGDRVQCVLGPAGSGKTFALEVAARAWEADGYHVIGAAVAGVAAEVLGNSVGIDASTVASLLSRSDNRARTALNAKTVIVVDEASTIGTRDLVRLLRLADRTGATIRLVGDPAQHGSVTAGGMFAHLVGAFPERTPELTVNRRQAGDDLTEVRLALDDYRHGHIRAAIERLDDDGRITTADSADDLLDTLVADWYVDRTLAHQDPTRQRSAMIAEHHYERAQLNARARAMLIAAGTIHGPALDCGGQTFQAGDEVISRKQARHLTPANGDAKTYLRNGTRGVVTAVDLSPGGEGLWVDFDQRGPTFVPREFLEGEVRRGVHGGLTHAYALTSHASQGETYAAGRHLATDRSSHQGVYVGLTRGKDDVRLYAVRHDQLSPTVSDDPQLPRLDADTRDARHAVATRLVTGTDERPATTHDPDALQVARLRRNHTPAELNELASIDGPDSIAARAWQAQQNAIAQEAIARPQPLALHLLGSRPENGVARDTWDQVATEIAIYQAVHPDPLKPDAGACWASLEPVIDEARTQIASTQPTHRTAERPEPGRDPAPPPAPPAFVLPAFELER